MSVGKKTPPRKTVKRKKAKRRKAKKVKRAKAKKVKRSKSKLAKSKKAKAKKEEVNESESETAESKEKQEIFKRFDASLMAAINGNDFFTAYCLVNEASEFTSVGKLSEKSYKMFFKIYERELDKKLNQLGFVDVSDKILTTTFYAMTQTGNLVLRGPPGVGKSFFAKKILPALWQQGDAFPRVITIQPDRNMDVASLVVEKGLKEGSTVPEEGQIFDAMTLAEAGKRIIMVLEEINQWPAKVLKDLNDFLQERRIEKKISGQDIVLECPKENLLVIANYNPEGETLGEDETGSVSSRFIFCDLPFPSREDIQKIIAMNVNEPDFQPLHVGYIRRKSATKRLLRAMADVCYSIRSAIQQGELGMMAMQLGTRHIINFSKALFENNTITEAIGKTLVDPILEKYVREGIKANVENDTYDDYVRTIFKAVKQVLGSEQPINENNLRSLQNGLKITINDLFKHRKQEAFSVELKEAPKLEPEIPAKIEIPIKPVSKIQKVEIRMPISSQAAKVKGDRTPEPRAEVLEEKLEGETSLSKGSGPIKKPSEELPKTISPAKSTSIRITTRTTKAPKEKREDGLYCPDCEHEMRIIASKKRTLLCPECSKLLSLPMQGEIGITRRTCSKHGYKILQIKPKNRDPYLICPECFDKEHITCLACEKDCK